MLPPLLHRTGQSKSPTSPASRGGEKTSSLDERSFQVTLQRGLGTGKRTMVAVFSSNLHTPGSLLSEKVQVGAEWEEGATVSGLRRDISLEERGPTPRLPFCKIIIKGLQLYVYIRAFLSGLGNVLFRWPGSNSLLCIGHKCSPWP